MKFIAYYIDKKTDKVIAAAAMNQMNKIQVINEAMKNGVMPKASVVKSGDFNIDQLLKDVNDKHPKCTRCGIWFIYLQLSYFIVFLVANVDFS